MTGELLLLLVGAGLILTGVLAGRPRGRGIRLAQVGRTPRVALAGAGLACLVAALMLMGSDGSGAQTRPITVAITDELGADQIREEIRVFLDGRDIGVVTVDKQAPTARLEVTFAKRGQHHYRLDAKRQMNGKKPVQASNNGDLVINSESRRLDVLSDDQGRTYLAPQQ